MAIRRNISGPLVHLFLFILGISCLCVAWFAFEHQKTIPTEGISMLGWFTSSWRLTWEQQQTMKEFCNDWIGIMFLTLIGFVLCVATISVFMEKIKPARKSK